MDPYWYEEATIGNMKVPMRVKEQLLNQVSFPAKQTVLHVIAQFSDSADAIREVLSGQDSCLQESLLIKQNVECETALYIASRNRRKRIVQELLDIAQVLSPDLEDGNGGVSLTSRMARMANKYGDTPLHEAVNNKDKEIVELLVKADPNYQHLPNNMGKTPLYIAFEKRIREEDFLIREFYSYFKHSYQTSLYDPTVEAILRLCKSPGMEGPHGETVLHAAARRENTSLWVRKICSKTRIDVKKQDEQGFTALHFAAYFDNDEVVDDLLQVDQSMAYITAAEDKHDRMTPLHIAASKGHKYVIKKILARCQDCWDVITSKGQNILHLAAKAQHTASIKFIVKQSFAINLLNMKDNDGNTPSHLLLSSMPKDYNTIKPLLQDPNVYFDAFNKENFSPLEMLEKAEMQFTSKKVRIMNKLQNKFGQVEKIPWMIDELVNANSKEEVINKTKRLEEMKKSAETHLLVATLIATVTFAAGFTLPGGYEDNGPNQGMAALISKSAFKVFVVTDTVALMSSCVAIFLHFTATLYKHDEEKISNRYAAALLFLVIAMISMAITFMMGLYVVLVESPGIAITICIIGCVGILYLLYLIRAAYRDSGFLIEEYLLEKILITIMSTLLCLLSTCICIPIFGLIYIFKEVGDRIWTCIGKRNQLRPIYGKRNMDLQNVP